MGWGAAAVGFIAARLAPGAVLVPPLAGYFIVMAALKRYASSTKANFFTTIFVLRAHGIWIALSLALVGTVNLACSI